MGAAILQFNKENFNLGLMRQTLRKVGIVVGLLTALGFAGKTACPNAEASYGLNDALGTVGIAAGIGTVIGLSTLAFYDPPGGHFSNVLVGAGAGLIVGLGVAAYLLANSPEDNEISPEELLPPENRPDDTGKKPEKAPANPEKKQQRSSLSPRTLASVPATFTPRALAHEWAVAIGVLELRF